MKCHNMVSQPFQKRKKRAMSGSAVLCSQHLEAETDRYLGLQGCGKSGVHSPEQPS